ncbi:MULTISPECIES: hypothetical protein [unclassified Gordonia (in: high G+C Gram-positive bacteria)]
MRFRSDFERLATLDAETIARVLDERRTDTAALMSIVTDCLDESLDLDAEADEAECRDDTDRAAYLRQEASAWRATVTALRRVMVHRSTATPVDGNRRGVA